ncbi:MAG TPA: PaaI family thioesterase [Xanthomonadales bacterium]|nr:PaaI family thioesterase [Xanthomonadales bacterium]
MAPVLTIHELHELLERYLPRVDHRHETIEALGDGALRMRLPVRPDYVSHDLPPGSGQDVLSGPILMGFADTALFACVHAYYGAEVTAAIVNFNVACLRVAGNGDLVAHARIVRKGRSIAFVEAWLHSGGSDEPCTHVTATYAVRATSPRA